MRGEGGYPLTCASFRSNGRVERNERDSTFFPRLRQAEGRGINHRYYRGKLGFFGDLRSREVPYFSSSFFLFYFSFPFSFLPAVVRVCASERGTEDSGNGRWKNGAV